MTNAPEMKPAAGMARMQRDGQRMPVRLRARHADLFTGDHA